MQLKRKFVVCFGGAKRMDNFGGLTNVHWDGGPDGFVSHGGNYS